MTISRITEKGQATIPVDIRQFLDLKSGDRVSFEIEKNKVVVKKATPMDWAYLSGLETQLSEWASEADSKAYDHL